MTTSHLPMVDLKEILSAARAIAEHLCATAIVHQDQCTWMGTTPSENNPDFEMAYATLGPDVYAGTSGISLFLSEMYAQTGDPRFGKYAEAGITHALGRSSFVNPRERFSFYSGTIGLAYAATRVGRLLQRPMLVARADNLLIELGRSLDQPGLYDVIFGAASGAPALLILNRWLGRADLIHWATRLGGYLLSGATKTAEGRSWGEQATGIASPRNLTDGLPTDSSWLQTFTSTLTFDKATGSGM